MGRPEAEVLRRRNEWCGPPIAMLSQGIDFDDMLVMLALEGFPADSFRVSTAEQIVFCHAAVFWRILAWLASVAVTSVTLVVAFGYYLAGDTTQRCLDARRPAGADETQVEVVASVDYRRGHLTCSWIGAPPTKISTRVLPLYQR